MMEILELLVSVAGVIATLLFSDWFQKWPEWYVKKQGRRLNDADQAEELLGAMFEATLLEKYRYALGMVGKQFVRDLNKVTGNRPTDRMVNSKTVRFLRAVGQTISDIKSTQLWSFDRDTEDEMVDRDFEVAFGIRQVRLRPVTGYRRLLRLFGFPKYSSRALYRWCRCQEATFTGIAHPTIVDGKLMRINSAWMDLDNGFTIPNSDKRHLRKGNDILGDGLRPSSIFPLH